MTGCGECTNGWRTVTEEYADRMAKVPTLDEAALTPEAAEVLRVQRAAERQVLLSSEYPCPACQPARHAEWASGRVQQLTDLDWTKGRADLD